MTRVEGRRLGLNVERYGAVQAGGLSLVLLHGFTGSAVTWAPFAGRLGRTHELVAVDLPGHGASDCPDDPTEYTAERTVEEILTVCDRLGLDRFHLLGYSLGGRVALHLAATAPERVETLILESASPGILDPAERAARRQSDEVLARLLEEQGIVAFVDRWERVPIFASQARLPAEVRARHRAQRLRNDPRGLASSLRGIGAGVPEPLQDRLGALTMTTLLVAGALDSKYVTLGREMAAALPRGRLAVTPEAGHAVHLEAPDAFAALVLDHLAAAETPAPAPAAGAAGAPSPEAATHPISPR